MNLKVSLRKPLKIREHRRILQNSLISSFLKYAVTFQK
nr:palindromic element RPE3 domain-containing protein [Rickettsia tillamookensis]